ncbi:MAG: cell division protein [Gammaproteobacteria bacterium]|nr:cell division protein [Gammaproteobacteria bacterium]
MTIAVIGIALAFPMGMIVLLQDMQTVSGGWNGATQISLFTKLNISDEQAAETGQRLRLMPEIESLHVLSRRNEAMNEFRSLSGFGEALDVLEGNPLPAVLIIKPAEAHNNPVQVALLVEKLRSLPEIDIAQLDLQWVKRLYTMMEIAERGILVIAALLALAVLLTIGNTIRLDIQGRRDEIIIVKLIGATNAFIRRPFLYTGFWYGLLGGLFSWILINISLGLLSGPVEQLAGLYGSNFTLSSMNAINSLILLGSSLILGLSGSWVAVSRHLHEIEPA